MSRTTTLDHLETILIVSIGGFAGSNLRYFAELIVPSSLVATLSVNVLGCAALGFFLYEEIYQDAISQPSRTLLATGVIASFTTYSTFVVDALTTTPLLAGAYLVASYALGFLAVLAGRAGAQRATGTRLPAWEVRE